ncbi:hypothetical protein C1I97_22400 [Streptomyces sp. NTH33]|uniref:hypothetical protein n=1 Tax=Streptomyces sp. NTH33 TaxID=1735453 RepID=UPI000DA9675E|nr:hypothetical protein [Streptomyces sp. NTH33]PZH01475.1 hypothetical protein C1I97_22400 [Streptomyces sp. NTH33]
MRWRNGAWRIGGPAGERALTVSVTGMAALALAGLLVARRIPAPAGAPPAAGSGREPPPERS